MAEGGWRACDEARAVVAIGKTGSGKSTLCNLLTDSREFPVGRGGMSVTVLCRGKTVRVRNRTLTVVDTPGTRDVNDSNAPLDVLRTVTLQHCPEGIDAFLVTVRCDVRMTGEECKTIEEAVDVFGPECSKRVIVVFTYGDVFDNDENDFRNNLAELRNAIPRFGALLSKFGERWLLMDNGSRCEPEVRERQMDGLFSLIDSVARLNPQRYSKRDLKSLDVEKSKHRAVKEKVKKLEKEIMDLRFQHLENIFQSQLQAHEREALMREKMMQMAMVLMHRDQQHSLQMQVQEMNMQQMMQLVDVQKQLMITNGEIDQSQEEEDSSCNIL